MKRGSLLLLQLCLLIGCFAVVRAQSRQERPKLNVAILVFEGVQIIDLIREALNTTKNRQNRAAELLGIKPTTLNSKIRKYKMMD